MLIDTAQRPLTRRERDVGNRAHHDDAQDHRQRLEPHEAEAHQDTEVQTRRQRATAQRDAALKPARTGQLHEDPKESPPPFRTRIDDHLPILLDARVHVHDGLFYRGADITAAVFLHFLPPVYKIGQRDRTMLHSDEAIHRPAATGKAPVPGRTWSLFWACLAGVSTAFSLGPALFRCDNRIRICLSVRAGSTAAARRYLRQPMPRAS